jgi:hypothetical protein
MQDWLELKETNAVDNPLLFLADDDVRFHLHFSSLYAELDSYCFDGLASGVGILKFQTAIWHQGHFPRSLSTLKPGRDRRKDTAGGWHLIDYEQSMTGSKCYSGHYAAVGSAATVYTRGAVKIILRWLDTGPKVPFDHVYAHLAHHGVPIRVTQPNLCISELDKESSVDKTRGTYAGKKGKEGQTQFARNGGWRVESSRRRAADSPQAMC